MSKLSKIGVGLTDLSKDDTEKLNKALLESKEDFEKDPVGTIIKNIISIECKRIEEEHVEKPKVVEETDNRILNMFKDDSYIKWLIDYCKKNERAYSISYDENNKLSDIDSTNLFNLSLFGNCVYKYAGTRNVYYYADNTNNPYYNIMHDGYRIAVTYFRGDSDIQCRIVTDAELYPDEEESINFEDIMNFYKQESIQRKRVDK